MSKIYTFQNGVQEPKHGMKQGHLKCNSTPKCKAIEKDKIKSSGFIMSCPLSLNYDLKPCGANGYTKSPSSQYGNDRQKSLNDYHTAMSSTRFPQSQGTIDQDRNSRNMETIHISIFSLDVGLDVYSKVMGTKHGCQEDLKETTMDSRMNYRLF